MIIYLFIYLVWGGGCGQFRYVAKLAIDPQEYFAKFVYMLNMKVKI
jgi:hypothetical protein